MPATSTAAQRFRANVLALLDAREITITQMAGDLGMSRPGVSRILHGHEDVTFARAERIAEFFGVELIALLKPPKKVRQTA